MTVHRRRPLPHRPALGRLLTPDAVLERTSHLLRTAGDSQPPHEGLVWWLGRNVHHDTIVLACHLPACDSGPQHVFADEAATGDAARAARALGLGIVAQVHSHPGRDTRHSDGDDELILMPYEGMFSLVVSEYGTGSLLPSEGAGLHQFQGERWIQVDDAPNVLVAIPEQISNA
jgi:proteasome lid subunit RPN8/RPN11